MKIISWNVNGLRAIAKKGFLDFLKEESPDICAIQEIKAKEDQLPPNVLSPEGYHAYFNPALRPGYSGTAIYSKKEANSVKKGLKIERFDIEGRILETEFENFTLLNIYFPNGKMSPERLDYKLDFYDACLEYFDKLIKEGKNLIIVGDYNTAHQEIDLARPKQNEKSSGFLRIERDWLDKLVSHGYSDCFRHFHKEDPDHYTWWSLRTAARARNVGWRIDYAFTNTAFLPKIKNAYHLPNQMGSDHCPVVVEL